MIDDRDPIEEPLTFRCEGETLVGVLHRPARPRRRGVIVVVGAPQYRVGSHRQFVLLARALCSAGFPVLRFDYRGMGDSDGDFVGFEGVEQDIRAAVDRMFEEVGGLSDIVLWGLCDGASAASFYAAGDPRVSGLIIVNPWVRTGLTLARARLTGYYLERLTSREFWTKALRAKVDWTGSLRELVSSAVTAAKGAEPAPAPSPIVSPARAGSADLPERVGSALRRFEKPTLAVLCGADLTAEEFKGAVVASSRMKPWLRRPGVVVKTLEGANHTYATAALREKVHAWTIEWLNTTWRNE